MTDVENHTQQKAERKRERELAKRSPRPLASELALRGLMTLCDGNLEEVTSAVN